MKTNKKENILITGGAGYIGSHTAYELNKNGYNCIIFDNFSEGNREFVKDYEIYEGDLKNIDDIKKVFQENKIDAVVHFAAYARVEESFQEPYKYFQNNVVNTIKLLDTMLEFDVKKIVFSSSCATYGIAQYVPIDEEHPQAPINPYGVTKYLVEQILKEYDTKFGLKSVSLRYFNAAGASEETELGEKHKIETHLIPLLLKTLTAENKSFTIKGTDYETPDGTCIRDFIHVSDLASAHRLALELLFNGTDSDCFNLATGKGYSTKEVINAVEKVAGKKIQIVESDRRPGDPPMLYADYKKAKKILGWEPKYINIPDIIKTAWRWHQT